MSKDRFDQFRRDYYVMTGTMARLGMEKKAKSGIYPLRLPIGYRRAFVDGAERIEIDSETGPTVRHAFKLAAQKRQSLTRILAVVRARGLKGHSGRPITQSALHRLLTNPFYAGVYKYKNCIVRGCQRPLVSRADWKSAKHALGNRAKRSKRKPASLHTRRQFVEPSPTPFGRSGSQGSSMVCSESSVKFPGT